ncbi:MAG TPA: hypothetical protein VG936_16345 [Lacunisphaera sp.]|nr:hypothetical protein [Lacunisphaera sp.]
MRASLHCRLPLWLALPVLLAGCAGIPAAALKLPPDSAADRERQSHRYEGVSEARLLSASLGVLQDLGFTVDGSEGRLGVVTGSKKLTARRPLRSNEVISRLALTACIPYFAPFVAYDAAAGIKEPQLVRLSLVTHPDSTGSTPACFVRVTAQRVVYIDEQLTGVKSLEALDDPRFFEEFFKRLSQSVFLQEGKT